MGSGDWIKTIINSKKVKDHSTKQAKVTSAHPKSNNFKWKSWSRRSSAGVVSGSAIGNKKVADVPPEDLAATIIQTAFRAYTKTMKRSMLYHKKFASSFGSRKYTAMARKVLQCLRGRARLQILTQKYSSKKQATSTLNHLHSWSKTQSQIRARRLCMVTEGRLRQKKLENQLKLEAKLHNLEVEWCSGAAAMEEVLAKIHLREEAAVKRERAMAYAFSHQWRANSSQNLGGYELGKGNWGWSWTDRWIAARPWESRVPGQSISPNKSQNKQGTNKIGKNTTSPSTKTSASAVPSLSNGNKSTKARRLSYPPMEKRPTPGETTKTEEYTTRREQSSS